MGGYGMTIVVIAGLLVLVGLVVYGHIRLLNGALTASQAREAVLRADYTKLVETVAVMRQEGFRVPSAEELEPCEVYSITNESELAIYEARQGQGVPSTPPEQPLRW